VLRGLRGFLWECRYGLLIGVLAPLAVWGLGQVHWNGSHGTHARATRTGPPVPARSFLERLIPSPSGTLRGVRASSDIRRLVARLPVERRVAQLLLVGFDGRDSSAPFLGTLRRMDLGGVAIQSQNYTGTSQLASLTKAIAGAASGRGHEPLLIVAPQEGGQFSAFPDLPPTAAAGDLSTPADAAAEARASARALKRLGLNGVLGPDIDVGASGPDPLGVRAFSSDPRDVTAYASATVSAYRGARMLAAPGHFPGIGAAAQSTDQQPTSVGLGIGDLEKRDLRPFRAAIGAGAPAVVLGHAAYQPDNFVVPGSLSHAIATNLLRGVLGYRGVAITDDLEAGAITSQMTVPDAAVRAIVAGADMVYISGPEADWQAAYRALVAAVRKGTISQLRLNTAVTRIVTIKRELGLRNRRGAGLGGRSATGAAQGPTGAAGRAQPTPAQSSTRRGGAPGR